MITSLICLTLSIACYSISQLQQHDKLRFASHTYCFWDADSWRLKYAGKWNFKLPLGVWEYDFQKAPNTWYYRVFKIAYKERWFTSTWLTVAFTDGYHLMQFFFFIFLTLSFYFAPDLDFWGAAIVYIDIHLTHWATYKFMQR